MSVRGPSLTEHAPALGDRGPGPVPVTLSVNGTEHAVTLEPRVSLLDALRERLSLTGTKKGCDQGSCGACTVWTDGRRVLACLTLAVACEGREITTIEGLAGPDGRLHPMQEAFVAEDAFQCGYCTPGQIMSAVALTAEGRTADGDIAEWMSGNLCRCAAYPHIRAAVRDVRDRAHQHRHPHPHPAESPHPHPPQEPHPHPDPDS